MRSLRCLAVAAVAAGLTTPVAAEPVLSFTGSYDEATGPETLPAGDYDVLGGPFDVGDFSLVGGVNTFAGSVFTPGDSSDVFNIVIGSNQTLVGASITFAENASAFNPYFGFPPPQWTLQESSITPVIFDIQMGPDPVQSFSPLTFVAPSFTRGAGIYAMLIGNGTFGMNNGGGVDYTMTFDVTETAVPEPAILTLTGIGLAGLGWAKRRRNRRAG